MSLTVPFLPLRLGSDDVGEENVFHVCCCLLLVFYESTGGIVTMQQLFDSVKLIRDLKMAAPSHLCNGLLMSRKGRKKGFQSKFSKVVLL